MTHHIRERKNCYNGPVVKQRHSTPSMRPSADAFTKLVRFKLARADRRDAVSLLRCTLTKRS